jgi:hypothetical protein
MTDPNPSTEGPSGPFSLPKVPEVLDTDTPQPTTPVNGSPSAMSSQVGGDHYKNLHIQPFEYSLANGLNACQHTAIKYITRYQEKGGIDDLKKAIHTIEFLIEWEGKVAAGA